MNHSEKEDYSQYTIHEWKPIMGLSEQKVTNGEQFIKISPTRWKQAFESWYQENCEWVVKVGSENMKPTIYVAAWWKVI